MKTNEEQIQPSVSTLDFFQVGESRYDFQNAFRFVSWTNFGVQSRKNQVD